MTEVVLFSPKRHLTARQNLNDFISYCRYQISIFGKDIEWDADYWPEAGVSFGNLDQKTSKFDQSKAMKLPFKNFAKAYYRYEHGVHPKKETIEIPMLRCVERALLEQSGSADISLINGMVMDRAATIAQHTMSPGRSYRIGNALEKMAKLISEFQLVPIYMDWKNSLPRPMDTVRTGRKAKEERERKLPDQNCIDALAEIFSDNPVEPKDIFTTSLAAMLLCAPQRVSEALAIAADCEVWEEGKNGVQGYGWRFYPGKGALPYVKPIPNAMITLAQEAMERIRGITEDARSLARWHEENPEKFYRHANCPGVLDDELLTMGQVFDALGYNPAPGQFKSELRRLSLPEGDYKLSLNALVPWVRSRLPKSFPWFDKERGIRFSEALFTFKYKQLRLDMPESPVLLWRPTANTFNEDLATGVYGSCVKKSIFNRHGYDKNRKKPLKMTSHQFRHLLNTMAQRGGLSQTQIAVWSGRADIKQNRVYDSMSEFELVELVRNHDPELSLDRPLEEIQEQLSQRLPMTRQEFNTLAIPMAHITEFGFCVHDFSMSPCVRFRDCINCTEQICLKGDQRVSRLKDYYLEVKHLKEEAEAEIKNGTAGADRWYEIQDLTEKRLRQLIEIMESKDIPDGTLIRLRNDEEFSPLRRAIETKTHNQSLVGREKVLLLEMKRALGGGDG